MDAAKRKELKNAYKTRTITGGIFCIECNGNHRKWIRSATDLEGSKNRFMFAVNIGGCPEPSMSREWTQYGTGSFSFTVLEELKKGETQSAEEFAADIDALYEIWLEKSEQGDL